MVKVDPGTGYRQLSPEEFVAWEHGDEFFMHRTEQWESSNFGLADRRQAGIIGVYRRPLKLGFVRGVKVLFRKARERFVKKKTI